MPPAPGRAWGRDRERSAQQGNRADREGSWALLRWTALSALESQGSTVQTRERRRAPASAHKGEPTGRGLSRSWLSVSDSCRVLPFPEDWLHQRNVLIHRVCVRNDSLQTRTICLAPFADRRNASIGHGALPPSMV